MSEISKINFEDTVTAFAHRSTAALRKTYFVFSTMKHPWMVKLGMVMTSIGLKLHLPVKGLIKSTLFDQFCGGESISGSEPRMIQLAQSGIKTILDYSVEGEASEEGYDEAMNEALKVADYARQHVSIPFCVIKLTGIGSTRIMEKKQSGQALSAKEQTRYDRLLDRIDKIVHRAVQNDLKFMIDAEESWIQDVIDGIACELMKKYNTKKPYVYNTYQLYRHKAFGNMKKDFEEVAGVGCFFAAKLVRGAYMEKERDRAEEFGHPDPIHPDKAATDEDYERGLRFAMDNIGKFALCAGTHNENSCQQLVIMMQKQGIARNDENVYFAQLLGMSDNISFKLSDMGYNVAKYVPYGPVEKVLPYLFRRAEENTSIAGQSGREYGLVKKELRRRRKTN